MTTMNETDAAIAALWRLTPLAPFGATLYFVQGEARRSAVGVRHTPLRVYVAWNGGGPVLEPVTALVSAVLGIPMDRDGNLSYRNDGRNPTLVVADRLGAHIHGSDYAYHSRIL